MSEGYTADEIFEIAKHIERDGEKFYREAAARTKNEAAGLLYLELAAAEAEHYDRLHALRQLATSSDESLIKQPDETVSLYLKLVAKGSVFNQLRPDDLPADEMDVLALAIDKELDSILYYYSMRDLLADDRATTAIDTIIESEREHVIRLATQRGMQA